MHHRDRTVLGEDLTDIDSAAAVHDVLRDELPNLLYDVCGAVAGEIDDNVRSVVSDAAEVDARAAEQRLREPLLYADGVHRALGRHDGPHAEEIVVLIIDIVIVEVIVLVRNDLVQRVEGPLAVKNERSEIRVDLIVLGEVTVDIDASRHLVHGRRDITGREVHLVVYAEVIIHIVTPPVLGERQVRNIAEVRERAVGREGFKASAHGTGHDEIILTVTRENRVLHVRAAEVRVVRLDIVDLHIVAILDVDVTLIKAVIDDIAVLGVARDIDVCGGSSV